MKLNDLKPARGSKTRRRRVGRGIGSGRGKTAGRGQKGQKSRSGFSKMPGWEGGRSRLIMRLPKRGFNKVKEPVQLVQLEDLNRFAAGSTVDVDALVDLGLVRHADQKVKLLGNGELEVENLTIDLDACSAGAAAAVIAKGGTVKHAPSAAAPSEADEAEETEEID